MEGPCQDDFVSGKRVNLSPPSFFQESQMNPWPRYSWSIAMHLPFLLQYLCKSMPSRWQNVVYTQPISITMRLPFVMRYFCRWKKGQGSLECKMTLSLNLSLCREGMSPSTWNLQAGIFESGERHSSRTMEYATLYPSPSWPPQSVCLLTVEASLLTVGTFLLTVELLCLQSAEMLVRRILPLQAKKLICKQKNSNSKKTSFNCKQNSFQHNCKQRSSIVRRKLPIVSKKLHPFANVLS